MSERVEQARADLDAIEQAMLASPSPSTIEMFRPARALALEALAEAEAAALSERDRRFCPGGDDMSPEIAEILARVEEERLAAARAVDPATVRAAGERQRLDALEEGLNAIERRLAVIAANTTPQTLRRSSMSPAAKSRYIREHGKQKYDAIPW